MLLLSIDVEHFKGIGKIHGDLNADFAPAGPLRKTVVRPLSCVSLIREAMLAAGLIRELIPIFVQFGILCQHNTH